MKRVKTFTESFFAIFSLAFIALSPSFAHAVSLGDLIDELNFLTERDLILSKNIANADTPGYHSKDLIKTPKVSDGQSTEEVGECELVVTSEGHMQDYTTMHQIIESDALEVKPGGNNITLELEMAKKQENSIELQEVVKTYEQFDEMLHRATTNVK